VFFIALVALYFLSERIGTHRIGAVIVGFIGVVIVMRPGIEGIVDARAFIPVLGAFGAAMAMTSVRKLSQTESTATLLFYQALIIGVMAGVPLFWLWVTPDLTGTLLLMAMGVIATVANWVGVKALRLGEASVIGNIQYTQLVYAAILGIFLFDEVPDIYTIIGATVIIGSSIYIFHREALVKKAKQD